MQWSLLYEFDKRDREDYWICVCVCVYVCLYVCLCVKYLKGRVKERVRRCRERENLLARASPHTLVCTPRHTHTYTHTHMSTDSIELLFPSFVSLIHTHTHTPTHTTAAYLGILTFALA